MGIQLKRSKTADLEDSYVLQQGQIGIEMPEDRNTATNSFKLKIGDGLSTWAEIPYFGIQPTELSEYLKISTKGAANGVASLDATGKVPESQLPVSSAFIAQTTAPSDTKLGWIDTANGNILKYYNGSAWTPIGAVWG